jgi:hypothetical protein
MKASGEFPRLVLVLTKLLFTPASSAMLESSFCAGPWLKPWRKNRMKIKRLSSLMSLYLNKFWRDAALWRAIEAWLYGSLDDLEREAELALSTRPATHVPPDGIVEQILDEQGVNDEDFEEGEIDDALA